MLCDGCSGTRPSGRADRILAEAFQEREEAKGFADAAQGYVEGPEIEGGIEEAVQAVIQEVEFINDGVLVLQVLPAQLDLALAGEVFGVAAEGGGAEAELRSQRAVGGSRHQAAIDLRVVGVRTDGTAQRLKAFATRGLRHKGAPGQEFPHDDGWISAYPGEGRVASEGERVDRESEIKSGVQAEAGLRGGFPRGGRGTTEKQVAGIAHRDTRTGWKACATKRKRAYRIFLRNPISFLGAQLLGKPKET
jgi:hypothetical protein